MLSAAIQSPLRKHLWRVRALLEKDVAEGAGRVALPDALPQKYPNANREWGWQWAFPASARYFDREAGIERRHHLHETVIQRNIKEAVRNAGIAKPASCHTLRHYSESRTMPSVSWPCQSAGSQTESVSEVRYRWHCREDPDHCRWPEREGSVVSSKDVRSWAMAQAEGYLRR